MLSLSTIHTDMHALILYLSLILRIWVHIWLVMFSHAVMSNVQVFPSFVILSLACVFMRDGLPSAEMWFNHGEDRCCDLSKVGIVEKVGFHQVMWFVMLEFAKDQILEVDTLGQHMSSRVQYRTACLLIRYAIGCVPCLVEWRWHHTLWPAWTTWYKREHLCGKL
jgi:hypothetical protein